MAGQHKTDDHSKTYNGVFMPLVKYGTPLFALLFLIVFLFTTK